MKKDTIELERDSNHIKGYGILPYMDKWNNESNILDAIVEWSRKRKTVKIYKHIVRVSEENISKDRFYVSNHIKTIHNEIITQIPYCDRVVYLDIYYQ